MLRFMGSQRVGYDLVTELNHLAGASPLPLDVGHLFLVGSNIFFSMVVQQRVVILEFSQEKMSTRPSTPPSCPYSRMEVSLQTMEMPK